MPSLMDWVREDEMASVEVDDTTADVPAAIAGPRRRRRWPWIVLAAICVVGCGITAWVTLQRPAQITQRSTDSRASGFTTYSDMASHYRISYPRNWQKATGADGAVVLHVRGRDAVSIRGFTLAKAVNPQKVADMRAV